jgi:uncharacterized small protein (DUF1192 family)
MSRYFTFVKAAVLPHDVLQVARETMLALLDPCDVEPFSASTATLDAHLRRHSNFDRPSFQKPSAFDEFGNDETEVLRQTVLDLRQQVEMLQSENHKLRGQKLGNKDARACAVEEAAKQ